MVHRITPADNSSKHVAAGPAFLGPNPGAAGDSLIVDENAYLLADTGTGVLLNGRWTVMINGTIGSFDGFEVGLQVDAALATDVTNVTIGVNGEVFGGTAIVFNEGGSITNKGTITSLSGNRPAISGLSSATLSVNNSGLIQGSRFGIGNLGDLNVNNSGTIDVGSTTTMHSGANLSITNAGLIVCTGPIGADGTLTLTNTGTMRGNGGIDQRSTLAAVGGAHITNTGTFEGKVFLGDGADVFTNFKKVKGVIKDGTVTGEIDLGAGADHFNGGGKHETVRDGDGTDIINFGGGNDIFVGIKTVIANNTDADVVDGGKGIDTYDASEATGAVAINLDTAEHGDEDNPTPGLTALGIDISTDHITGFENATGGAGADLLAGSNGANVLIGNAGADILIGLGGADVLTGDTGSLDNDIFQFLKLSDSGPTVSKRDLITDFQQGFDKIDVAAIVASAGAMFDFIGLQQFDHAAGQFRESFSHGNTILSGDLNGDGKADFSVALKGHFLLDLADFA